MQENELIGPDPHKRRKSWSPYGRCWKCAGVHQETNGSVFLLYSLPSPCIFSFTFSVFMQLMLFLEGNPLLACFFFFPQWCC